MGSPLRSQTLLWAIVCAAISPASLVVGDLKADGEALLGFAQGLAAASRVIASWSNSSDPCAWEGVTCNQARDSVISLELPAAGLYGGIQPNTLSLLPQLQTLSLRSNHLSGALPADLPHCTRLRKLFLQNNLLSGPIPLFSLSLTPALGVIDLSFNALSGPIPASIASLSLRILLLQNNSLSGPIPPDLRGLAELDLAYNDFNGSIPPGIRSMPRAAFSGNAGLCGPPLPLPCSSSPASSPAPAPTMRPPPLQPPLQTPHQSSLTSLNIILMVVAGALFLLLLLACCLLCLARKSLLAALTPSPSTQRDAKGETKADVYGKSVDESMKDEFASAQEPHHNKLVFFQDKQLSFDLEDLLRASAEVLGKGSFGTSYKAVLEDGPVVVVKRLKEVSVGRKDFEQQLDIVGRVRNRHLVPLRAYYYSKEERLLVHEYLPLGSLSAALHDGPSKRELDWETRLKIAMAAGKGLAHLHAAGSRSIHGDIKSSNVLLHATHDACLSDFGITPVFSPNLVVGRVGSYRAPELTETRKVSQMSDVFSFGVVLLELLTGKAPWLTINSHGMELPRWVQSVVREEWTSEVFDKALLRYHNIEEEMVQMLQIALACVQPFPAQRPPMHDVLNLIVNVRPSLLQTESESSPSSNDNGGVQSQGIQPDVFSPEQPRGSSSHQA